jgi:hypothetical protein
LFGGQQFEIGTELCSLGIKVMIWNNERNEEQKCRCSVKGGSWMRIMRDELQQIGLGNSWLEEAERFV